MSEDSGYLLRVVSLWERLAAVLSYPIPVKFSGGAGDLCSTVL